MDGLNGFSFKEFPKIKCENETSFSYVSEDLKLDNIDLLFLPFSVNPGQITFQYNVSIQSDLNQIQALNIDALIRIPINGKIGKNSVSGQIEVSFSKSLQNISFNCSDFTKNFWNGKLNYEDQQILISDENLFDSSYAIILEKDSSVDNFSQLVVVLGKTIEHSNLITKSTPLQMVIKFLFCHPFQLLKNLFKISCPLLAI